MKVFYFYQSQSMWFITLTLWMRTIINVEMKAVEDYFHVVLF